MIKQTRNSPLLLFLLAQFIAGGLAVLIWPRFLVLVHTNGNEYLIGPCILFVGILNLVIFLVLGKKETFSQLLELKRLSKRDGLLLFLIFIVSTLIGLTAKNALLYLLRSYAVLQVDLKIMEALCVILPFLVFDLNLLINERAVNVFIRFNTWFISLLEKTRKILSNTISKNAFSYLTKPLSIAFIITTLFFGTLFLLFRIGYAVDDDIAMISIVSGYLGGSPTPFMVHGNIIIGYLMQCLYNLDVGQNWYVLFLIFVNILSSWILIYIMLAQHARGSIKALGILAIILCNLYFVINITFTVVAALTSLAGFVLLISGCWALSQKRKLSLFFGFMLIFLGSMIRIETTLQMALIVIPVIFVTVRYFHFRTLFLSLVLAGSMVILGYAINQFDIGLHPEWNQFYIYSHTRALLHDTPRLANLTGTYQQVGWSLNDLNSFANWFFPDPKLYSLQNLHYLVEHTPQVRVNFGDALGFLNERLFSLVSLPYLFLLFAVYLGIVLSKIPVKKVLISTLPVLCATLATNIYLALDMKIPNRVLLPSLTACILVSYIYFISSVVNQPVDLTLNNDFNRISLLGFNSMILSLLLAVGLELGQTVLTSRTNVKRQATYHQAARDLNTLQEQGIIRPDALIVSPAYGLPLAWSDPLEMEFPRIQYLDMGWLTFAPSYDAVLHDFGISSLANSLYNKDNVYLMTTPSLLENVRLFVQEHEGVEVDSLVLYKMPDSALGTAYEHATLYKLLVHK